MSIVPKDWLMYVKTGVFGLLVFGAGYGYIKWLGTPGELNKSVADTAIILIGLSMLISSVSYYVNFLDWSVAYRKHLGLIGFAFALAHLLLSWGAFLNLFTLNTWEQGRMWPALTGTAALLIFAGMALVSNTVAARIFGKSWRGILRTGYIAVGLVLLHVFLLRSARWMSWYRGGMKTPPSLSLLVGSFMLVVLVMRLALWFNLRKNRN